MSRVLVRLYDVAIVLPLLVERLVKGSRRAAPADKLDVDDDLSASHVGARP